jgi:hypothetical protein
MSCDISIGDSVNCLVFATEAACDTALALQNSACGACAIGICTAWAEKAQRADGKFWFFKNPYLMAGVVDYTDEVYSDAMEA